MATSALDTFAEEKANLTHEADRQHAMLKAPLTCAFTGLVIRDVEDAQVVLAFTPPPGSGSSNSDETESKSSLRSTFGLKKRVDRSKWIARWLVVSRALMDHSGTSGSSSSSGSTDPAMQDTENRWRSTDVFKLNLGENTRYISYEA